jgi:hypothetical protein
MAVYDALELVITGRERPEYVRASEGTSIERERDLLLNRQGKYENGWVFVEGADERYMRYEAIESVTIRKGLDDEMGPFAFS